MTISVREPYMAKDIKVLKGGFGAEYGEGWRIVEYTVWREPSIAIGPVFY